MCCKTHIGAGGLCSVVPETISFQPGIAIGCRQSHSVHAVLPRSLMIFQIRARDDALPVAHIALAVEGPGWADPDNVVLNVANAIVGRYDRTFGGGKVRGL